MTDIRIPNDQTAEFFTEHDVWCFFAENNEDFFVYANEKGRRACGDRFKGHAPWVTMPSPVVPADWQALRLPGGKKGLMVLVDWCVHHGCTAAVDGGDGMTATIPPQD
jgi:hypothetical protein